MKTLIRAKKEGEFLLQMTWLIETGEKLSRKMKQTGAQ